MPSRISVFHVPQNRSTYVLTAQYSLLLLGSGAGDFLSDGVWTVLLLLQANVAGTVDTGRYVLDICGEHSCEASVPLLFLSMLPLFLPQYIFLL